MTAPDKWLLLRAFDAVSTDEGLADSLVGLWEAAHQAWPGIEVDASTYMRALAERANGDLGALRTSELYLACACLAHDETALRAFDARVISQLARAIEGIDSSRDFVDEVSQRVRERLLIGSPPRLHEYSGQGSLVGWARTVAVRLALNFKRDTGREAPANDDEVLERLPLSGADVELDYVRAQHRADFAAAFRDALAALEPRDRNVLRLSYVDRLSIDQIGAIYGTHRATAARWLNAARDLVVAGTREKLAERLKLTRSDVDSLLGALQSNLEISLRGFLGPG